MAFLILVRILAFAATYWISHNSSWVVGNSVFFATLYAHYVIQGIYSTRQLSALARPRNCFKWIGLAAMFSFAYFTPYLPLGVFFCAHFIFSEVYTSRLYQKDQASRYLRILAGFSIYALFCADTPYFQWIPTLLLRGALGLSCLGLLTLALTAKQDRRKSWGLLAYECIGAAFALAHTPVPLEQRDIVFYHVVWWVFYPLPEVVSKTNFRYLLYTAAIAPAIFLLTPWMGLTKPDFIFWSVATAFAAPLHIVLSFSQSGSNPRWISRLFGVREKAPNLALIAG